MHDWSDFSEEEKYAEWSDGVNRYPDLVGYVAYCNFWDDMYDVQR